jgi:hypothetical protein
MEGPSANNVSVTNCLRMVEKFKGVRNLSGYKPEKITTRAINAKMTG